MAKTCPSPYDVTVTSRDKGRQRHLVQDFVPVLWLTIQLPPTVWNTTAATARST